MPLSRLALIAGTLLLASAAQAQQAVTVSACSARASKVGDGSPLSVLPTGELCVTGGTGGGTGTASTVTANQGTAGATPWPITWTGNLGVTVSNFPATQVVSGTVALGAGSASIGTIGNTAFGISGTLPAFAATPTFKIDQTTAGTTNGVVVNSSALPAGAATAANQSAEIASLTAIGQRAVLFSDFGGTATTANATLSGPIHDMGTTPAYSSMNAAIFSSQAGTVSLQACGDSACAVTAFTVASQAITAGGSGTTQARLVTRWWRVQFANGATAGTVTAVSSATAN